MPEIAQANVPPFEYVDVPVSAQGGAAQQEQHAAAAAGQYSHGGQYDGYGQGQYAGSVASQPQGYGSSAASQYGGYAAPAAPQYAAPTPPPAAPAAPATYNQSIYDPAGNYGKSRQTYLGSYPSAEPKQAYPGPLQQQPPPQPPALQPQHSGYSTASAPAARQQFVPQAPGPAPPQPYHPAAPPAPTSPYAQHGGAPSHPHSPGAGARPQQFAPEQPQQQPARAPAVFQPMHAAAPRPAPPTQQMQAPPQPQAPPAPPAPPLGPPPDCTVYTVDTSNVSSQALPIIQNLMGLFQVPSMTCRSLTFVNYSL